MILFGGATSDLLKGRHSLQGTTSSSRFPATYSDLFLPRYRPVRAAQASREVERARKAGARHCP